MTAKAPSSVVRNFASRVRALCSGTLLSRISGLFRDLAMTYLFGANEATAGFILAFRFSTFLRRFFGEGPLQAIFIPHFEGLRLKDEGRAYLFFRQLSFLLLSILFLLVGLVEIGLIGSLRFSLWSAANREVILFTLPLLPALIMISLYGLNISLLQCHNAFFLSSIGPFLCNLCWIVGAFILKNHEIKVAMSRLTIWVFFGFFLQWIITLPFIFNRAKGALSEWINVKFYLLSREIKALFCSFGWGFVGIGAVQLNVFFDAIFARCADSTGPVYLWHGGRIQQFALAMFGTSIVHTLAPALSQAVKKRDLEGGSGIFAFGYRRIVTLLVPCTAAIICLGDIGLSCLHGRGEFSSLSVTRTYHCLVAYTLGLVPSALAIFYATVLHAEGRTYYLSLCSVAMVIINLSLDALFVFLFHWGSVSTALATAIAVWSHLFLLRRGVEKGRWVSQFSLRDWGHLCLVTLLASSFTSLSVHLTPYKWVSLLMGISIFSLTLVGYALLFDHIDLKNLLRESLMKQKKRVLPT